MKKESCERISAAMTAGNDRTQVCEICKGTGTHRYQLVSFTPQPQDREYFLCVRCARIERTRLLENSADGLTREELIAELDRFFAASGVLDICRRCHLQGTGCCPPTCRVMGRAGCDPDNQYGKTVFCASFICGALLNAISECDSEIGRELKRIKREFGPTEFRIYEMITRVPAPARTPLRILALPPRYPRPAVLDGEKIRTKLGELANEVLDIRRRWHEQEVLESGNLETESEQQRMGQKFSTDEHRLTPTGPIDA